MPIAKLYTVAEVARALRLSEHTIRCWILTHKIVYIKIGRAVRIAESEIDRLIEGGSQKSDLKKTA